MRGSEGDRKRLNAEAIRDKLSKAWKNAGDGLEGFKSLLRDATRDWDDLNFFHFHPRITYLFFFQVTLSYSLEYSRFYPIHNGWKFIHGDIRSNNLLVDSSNNVYFIDFHCAAIHSTPEYLEGEETRLALLLGCYDTDESDNGQAHLLIRNHSTIAFSSNLDESPLVLFFSSVYCLYMYDTRNMLNCRCTWHLHYITNMACCCGIGNNLVFASKIRVNVRLFWVWNVIANTSSG